VPYGQYDHIPTEDDGMTADHSKAAPSDAPAARFDQHLVELGRG